MRYEVFRNVILNIEINKHDNVFGFVVISKILNAKNVYDILFFSNGKCIF